MEGKGRESIGLLKEIMRESVEPDGFTLSALVKACGELVDLKLSSCVQRGRF